jgi:rRNA maturation endonuclease Nob1
LQEKVYKKARQALLSKKVIVMKLRCMNCNYKFTPKARVPTMCPFCGSHALRKDETTGDILAELDRNPKGL